MTKPSPIETAIGLFGSEAKIARAIGYSQVMVNRVRNGARISAEMAVAIDKATDRRVSKYELRPDLFDAPAAARKVRAA